MRLYQVKLSRENERRTTHLSTVTSTAGIVDATRVPGPLEFCKTILKVLNDPLLVLASRIALPKLKQSARSILAVGHVNAELFTIDLDRLSLAITRIWCTRGEIPILLWRISARSDTNFTALSNLISFKTCFVTVSCDDAELCRVVWPMNNSQNRLMRVTENQIIT